ncbi:YeeE/YedE family protein [Ideonella azotifigens]|uniref:YeeE/YedE family protein n=1 Tax=Ideonella azotifigens TaxID=513160 RepID=A0ABN1K2H8_9BURK|nr:YeeE/YedE family protein [Ideonella azotifigens]MCD2343854.1 YeeE/YedE family protein [Ideonella azotifigens]
MHIDWSSFTPWPALAGGALIGLAAAAMALLLGRVAGISGILGGLLRPSPGESRWRLAFLIGLLLAPWLVRAAGAMPPLKIEASSGLLIVAGLLVGVGTRYGAGCTSGHGVCGLSRLSGRSLVATLVFMAAGFVTVALVRHGGVL